MEREFVLAIDQGTTATTALVLSLDMQVLAKSSTEVPQIYPRPGWVEHDPESIWKATVESCVSAIDAAGLTGEGCMAVGITNQRETTFVWNRKTGEPYHNAIVWQCRRTAEICEEIEAQGLGPRIREKTGLVVDPYFSATKLTWLMRHVEGLRDEANRGDVCFGTADSYLIFRLTGGDEHVTDTSNASRTLLFDISLLRFDEGLCELFDVPKQVLPEVVPSAGVVGKTKGLGFLPDGVPISGIAGDQQAALFGQACIDKGLSKCTYGTGAFLLAVTGSEPAESRTGLLQTVAWTIGDTTEYALEGSSFVAGAAVQWLRDGLGLIKASADVERLANTVEDTGGVVFVPALAGLGAPYWKPAARGAVFGITRATTAGHVARAVLEGVALQVAELAQAMQRDLGRDLVELRVDGGASANDLLMQFQADLLNVPVVRPRVLETTAMGAAMLAAIGIGILDIDSVRKVPSVDRRFVPGKGPKWRKSVLERYRKAVDLCVLFGENG